MIRSKLISLIPFLSRWSEVSAANACCGVCAPCVAATAGSLLLPLVVRERKDAE